MSSIIGIPTTRVSDSFIRQRMLTQVQSDQAEMFRIQTQLSTGHRFEAPSEDPIAAQRVMGLQSLLERKAQVKSNLTTNQSYLSATDSAMGNIASLLSDARATALGAIGTTATDMQRQAAAQQIDQTIRQMIDMGNQQFRGRYIFAGSSTQVKPFSSTDAGYIEYLGNEGRVPSFADIDQLFDTNLNGSEAFGAISQAVTGGDLKPALNYDTRLADLRHGAGVTPGSIAITDGHSTSTIDISSAARLATWPRWSATIRPPGAPWRSRSPPRGWLSSSLPTRAAASIRPPTTSRSARWAAAPPPVT
jgi:flagellar hook-associated protein 3 FlgL